MKRLVLGTALYGVEIAGSAILMAGSISGLFIAAGAMVLDVAFMISAAWLLVVGVYSARAQT